ARSSSSPRAVLLPSSPPARGASPRLGAPAAPPPSSSTTATTAAVPDGDGGGLAPLAAAAFPAPEASLSFERSARALEGSVSVALAEPTPRPPVEFFLPLVVGDAGSLGTDPAGTLPASPAERRSIAAAAAAAAWLTAGELVVTDPIRRRLTPARTADTPRTLPSGAADAEKGNTPQLLLPPPAGGS
ncbi:unnamed protein product, partial [Ectocarpus sp. 12 AP-2014]